MDFRIERSEGYWRGSFEAMASPCEVLVDTDGEADARGVVGAVAAEAARVEEKLSRYRPGNPIDAINNAGGSPVSVDDEIAGLLDFADRCWTLSDGRFDITSGVLRRVWKFDGSDQVPGGDQVAVVLESVGWEKVGWQEPWIKLPQGMEIDLGGIGKEYAVDRALQLAVDAAGAPVVVNFGGDLAISGPRRDDSAWDVGVENPQAEAAAVTAMALRDGALATSGDARRFLVKDGVRYGHILDPTTGWPVAHAPRSVTVHAGTCTEAGLLATLAMLEGADAEAFLEAQHVRFWCVR